MACFWEGILSSLTKDDKDKLGIINSIPDLIKALQKYNTLDIKVLWQNKVLTKKQREENYTHVEDYRVSDYNKGYLCGTCDPFLILLGNTLNVNIKHEYLNSIIIYSHESSNIYVFKSDRGHFTYKNKI
tara:strand:+ start:665 stop:1051 length:387 start_codon:yes stop_codon:yes gene_type:complete